MSSEADVARHLWPHLHATFACFRYSNGGVVELAPIDDAALRIQAQATADLVGLLKRPGHGLTQNQLLRRSDRRWEKRRDAWSAAVAAQADLLELRTDAMIRRVVAEAAACGFWSVWVTVFAGDPEVRAALCERFPGTAADRA